MHTDEELNQYTDDKSVLDPEIHSLFDSIKNREPSVQVYEVDISFYQVNYQILDYNINILTDVINKIYCIISNQSHIKKRKQCINWNHEGIYKEHLVSSTSLMEYIDGILPAIKIRNIKLYKILKNINTDLQDSTLTDVNDVLRNVFFVFANLSEEFTWMVDIKKMVRNYQRNVEYVYNIINENGLIEYGYNVLYEDLLSRSESYDGTPLKKICIRKDNKLNKNISDLNLKETNKKFDENKKFNENKKFDENKKFNENKKINENTLNLNEKNRKEELVDKKLIPRDNIIFGNLLNDDVFFDVPLFSNDILNSNLLFNEIEEDLLKIEHLNFTDLPQNVIKIAEASFSEVFKDSNFVYKIVPLDGEGLTKKEDFIKECKIHKIISKNPGISTVESVSLVTGKYTPQYLKAWDKFGFEENERPDKYTSYQEYGVLVTNDGGKCLEKYKFRSVNEIIRTLQNITNILADLERDYEFEHRDLHWGNILIKDGEVKIIDFTLSRLKYRGEVIFTDLNKMDWIFQGDASYDEQFQVYRDMLVASKGDWKGFYPINNVKWMRYLVNKLFSQIDNKKSNKIKETQIKILDECGSIQDYEKKAFLLVKGVNFCKLRGRFL